MKPCSHRTCCSSSCSAMSRRRPSWRRACSSSPEILTFRNRHCEVLSKVMNEEIVQGPDFHACLKTSLSFFCPGLKEVFRVLFRSTRIRNGIRVVQRSHFHSMPNRVLKKDNWAPGKFFGFCSKKMNVTCELQCLFRKICTWN